MSKITSDLERQMRISMASLVASLVVLAVCLAWAFIVGPMEWWFWLAAGLNIVAAASLVYQMLQGRRHIREWRRLESEFAQHRAQLGLPPQ